MTSWLGTVCCSAPTLGSQGFYALNVNGRMTAMDDTRIRMHGWEELPGWSLAACQQVSWPLN